MQRENVPCIIFTFVNCDIELILVEWIFQGAQYGVGWEGADFSDHLIKKGFSGKLIMMDKCVKRPAHSGMDFKASEKDKIALNAQDV